MRILYLTVTKRWFDLIAAGIKHEEYRELKPYWINRLCWHEFHNLDEHQIKEMIAGGLQPIKDKYYGAICLKNGYQASAPKIFVQLKNISIGRPLPEWSDSMLNDVFVLSLGRPFSSLNALEQATTTNSNEPPENDIDDSDIDDFIICDNCDLPDACRDFGCAIAAGIKKVPFL